MSDDAIRLTHFWDEFEAAARAGDTNTAARVARNFADMHPDLADQAINGLLARGRENLLRQLGVS